MIGLNVNVDAARLLLDIERLTNGPKRFAFAIERAGNSTLKLMQGTAHEHVEDRLTIRRPEFFFGTAGRPGGAAGRITHFFSVRDGRPFGEIAISSPRTVSSRQQLLLGEFERGGSLRRPFTPGAKRVAVPVTGGPARPQFSSTVPAAFTFKGLSIIKVNAKGEAEKTKTGRSRRTRAKGLKFTRHVTASGAVQWRGAHRTFILEETARSPFGGVYQRVGPGRDDMRTVYSFRDPFALADRLDWEPRVRSTGDRWFGTFLEDEVRSTLRFHGLLAS